MNLLQRLDKKARRGSKPRCHWLTHGERTLVASRLTKLVEPRATVSCEDFWMPDGFSQVDEACLDKVAGLLPLYVRETILDWWLAVPSPWSKTPTFDIASTCTIEGKTGLLLVEAKAHAEELNNESKGKELKPPVSPNTLQNHQRIGERILEANSGLGKSTGLTWRLSRDHCYQMSNRFAWSWKLVELGYPVILVYLGFLNAKEMQDRGDPIRSHAEWKVLVKEHIGSRVPDSVWEKRMIVCGRPLIPCLRSLETPYDRPFVEA